MCLTTQPTATQRTAQIGGPMDCYTAVAAALSFHPRGELQCSMNRPPRPPMVQSFGGDELRVRCHYTTMIFSTPTVVHTPKTRHFFNFGWFFFSTMTHAPPPILG